MKTIGLDAGEEKVKAYLEDWCPGREFIESLGYNVFGFDPDFGCSSKDGKYTFSIPREFVDRVMEKLKETEDALRGAVAELVSLRGQVKAREGGSVDIATEVGLKVLGLPHRGVE